MDFWAWALFALVALMCILSLTVLRPRNRWEWNGQAALIDDTPNMNDTIRINVMVGYPPRLIEFDGVLFADEGEYDEKGWRIYTNSFDVYHAKPQPPLFGEFIDTPEAWEARKVIPGETREQARERLAKYRRQ